MLSQNVETFLNINFNIEDALKAAKTVFFDAALVIRDPDVSKSGWVSFVISMIAKPKEGDEWTLVATAYKDSKDLPAIRLTGFKHDEKLWSTLREALVLHDTERKQSLLLPGSATSPSSASPNATPTNANSSPSLAVSSMTAASSYTSPLRTTTPTPPSTPVTKPLVAAARDIPSA